MDMIVYDDEIRAAAEFCQKTGSELESMYIKYLQALRSIRNEALTKGAAADRLSAFISYAETLTVEMLNISNDMKKHMNSYLTDVDTADQFLF